MARAGREQEQALDDVGFPEHEQIGQTLVRPPVFDELREELEPGLWLADVEELLDTYGIEKNSALLAELDYKVGWDGLRGGTIQSK